MFVVMLVGVLYLLILFVYLLVLIDYGKLCYMFGVLWLGVVFVVECMLFVWVFDVMLLVDVVLIVVYDVDVDVEGCVVLLLCLFVIVLCMIDVIYEVVGFDYFVKILFMFGLMK